MNETYWGLPTLSHFIRWLEELVAILSKPFLMLGFIVSTLDLLTNGQLLTIWYVSFGWALIQAVALDATFFVTWHKAKKAALAWQILPFLGYALLGLALGVVAWAAMDLQSLEQALGIASPEAMARLGLNPVMLVHLRSLVAVIMGGVVAMITPEATTAKHENARSRKLWLPQWAMRFLAWLGFKAKPVQQSAPVPTPAQPEQSDQSDHLLNTITDHSKDEAIHQIIEQVQALATSVGSVTLAVRELGTTSAPKPLPQPVIGTEYVPITVLSTSDHLLLNGSNQDGYSFVEYASLVEENTDGATDDQDTDQPTPITSIGDRSEHDQPNIGDQVKRVLRQSPHLSNREIAGIVGCSASTVSTWRRRVEVA